MKFEVSKHYNINKLLIVTSWLVRTECNLQIVCEACVYLYVC